MLCPFCGHLEDKVVDSRESKEGESIRRRRECLNCARRFTSYERIDEIPTDKPIVVHCAAGYRSAAAASIIAAKIKSVPVYDLSEAVLEVESLKSKV